MMIKTNHHVTHITCVTCSWSSLMGIFKTWPFQLLQCLPTSPRCWRRRTRLSEKSYLSSRRLNILATVKAFTICYQWYCESPHKTTSFYAHYIHWPFQNLSAFLAKTVLDVSYTFLRFYWSPKRGIVVGGSWYSNRTKPNLFVCFVALD